MSLPHIYIIRININWINRVEEHSKHYYRNIPNKNNGAVAQLTTPLRCFRVLLLGSEGQPCF